MALADEKTRPVMERPAPVERVAEPLRPRQAPTEPLSARNDAPPLRRRLLIGAAMLLTIAVIGGGTTWWLEASKWRAIGVHDVAASPIEYFRRLPGLVRSSAGAVAHTLGTTRGRREYSVAVIWVRQLSDVRRRKVIKFVASLHPARYCASQTPGRLEHAGELTAIGIRQLPDAKCEMLQLVP